jgi:Dolichyl-phosphate-mannose-protein mannosyltransferase
MAHPKANADATPGPAGGTGPRPARAATWLVPGAAAVLALVWCGRLGLQAAGGTFATDECFHAHVAGWIAAHGRIPDRFPDLYGGFAYYYQPLLHLIGAAALRLFGPPALHLLSCAFALLTCAVVLWAAPRVIPSTARAWALLLCLTSSLLAAYAVRLYAEGLTTLLVTAGAAVWVRHMETPSRRWTLALGIVTGLALLTKFTGWMLVGLMVATLVAELARGRAARVRDALLVLGVALVIAAPWLIRNQVLFGSMMYPLGAPDLDATLLALQRARFSIPPGVFLAGLPGVLGVFVSALALMAAVTILIERRAGTKEALWLFAVIGLVTVALMPMAAPRHLTPFVPVLALSSAWIVVKALDRRPVMRMPVGVVLFAAAAFAIARMPDYRRTADPPPALVEAVEAVRREVPERDTVLSLWTYATFYYGRRPATWPLAWGQQVSPEPLFETSDPARFGAALDSLGIDAILMPAAAEIEPYTGSNYPESFVTCARVLLERGTLAVAWSSASFVLLRRRS